MYDLVISIICDLIELLPVLFGIRIVLDFTRVLIFNDR